MKNKVFFFVVAVLLIPASHAQLTVGNNGNVQVGATVNGGCGSSPCPIAQGGTGATTSPAAVSNLLSNPSANTGSFIFCSTTSNCVPAPLGAVSVESFGAKCDAVLDLDTCTVTSGTDDTASWQSALNSGARTILGCSNGNSSLITHMLTVPSGVTIEGNATTDGVFGNGLVYTGDDTGAIVNADDALVTIEDFSILDWSPATPVNMIQGGNLTLDKVLVGRNTCSTKANEVSVAFDYSYNQMVNSITQGQITVQQDKPFWCDECSTTITNTIIHDQHGNSNPLEEPALIVLDNNNENISLVGDSLNADAQLSPTTGGCLLQYAEGSDGNGNLSLSGVVFSPTGGDPTISYPYAGSPICNTNGLTPTSINGDAQVNDITGPNTVGPWLGQVSFNGILYQNGGLAGPIQQTGNSTTPCDSTVVSVGTQAICTFTISAANLVAFDGTSATAVTAISAPGSGRVINLTQPVSSIVNYVAGANPYSAPLNLWAVYPVDDSYFFSTWLLDISQSSNQIGFSLTDVYSNPENGLSSGYINSPFWLYGTTLTINGIGASHIDSGAQGTLFNSGDTFTDSNCANPATGTVTGTGVGGSITSYTFSGAGNYPGGGCTIADGDALVAVTGSGQGATIDVTALTANGDGTVVVRIPYTTVTAQ